MATKSCEVVIFDGATYRNHRADIDDAGIIRTREHPTQEFSGAAAHMLWPGKYLLPVEPVALMRENDFHVLRKQVSSRWLFKSSSDFVQLAQQGAAVACVILALFFMMVLHGVQTSIDALTAQQNALQQQIQNPGRYTVPSGYQLVPTNPQPITTPNAGGSNGK